MPFCPCIPKIFSCIYTIFTEGLAYDNLENRFEVLLENEVIHSYQSIKSARK